LRWLRDFLRAFASEGRTVLISSNVLAEVAQTVDQVLTINRSRLVGDSPPPELTAQVRHGSRPHPSAGSSVRGTEARAPGRDAG
jgi:ABC-type multidrug transport system ATPase subunit